MNVSNLKKSECCGCGMCVEICPCDAIRLVEDEAGFVYPSVEKNKCNECGLCRKACAFNHTIEVKLPIQTYAAARREKDRLMDSSSGGVFAAIAEYLISNEKDWMVVGSALDENMIARHMIVDSVNGLKCLYGSKYVQSSTEGIYKRIKDEINNNKKILFCGTPCQVAAVKRFVDDEKLYTIELICHGVPNQRMFSSYLQTMSDNITNYTFRDKKQGWSFNGLLECGNCKKKINHRLSSYMTYFLNGEIYRESCYECPYAKPERGADITIGDFWGCVGQRKDLSQNLDVEKGVSCLLINTQRGMDLIEKSDIDKFDVKYEEIKSGNEPLNSPSTHTNQREDILEIWYKDLNWADVNKYWKKKDYKLIFLLWSYISPRIQHKIRVFLGKR